MTNPVPDTLPDVIVTAVGSMPHKDPDAAVNLVLETLLTAPHIPQLSRAYPKEQMWVQCTENLPRFRVDLQDSKYHFDTSGDYTAELERFYSHYLEVMEGGPADYFAVSEDYGKGIHTLLRRLQGRKAPIIKLQVTGPLSFALTIPDEAGKPIFYHDVFRDVAVKGMALKAIWLIDQFKDLADHVILFYDEPSLSAYGSSAFLGVSKSDVVETLDEVFSAASDRGAIIGVHCCGNTDWGLMMESIADIINFDAINYLDTMPIYARELNRFLERGGIPAWGSVPNDDLLPGFTPERVLSGMRYGVKILTEAGVDKDLLEKRTIITPACGCAGLSEQGCRDAYSLLAALDSMSAKQIFG